MTWAHDKARKKFEGENDDTNKLRRVPAQETKRMIEMDRLYISRTRGVLGVR
jgi:hypothetical protein